MSNADKAVDAALDQVYLSIEVACSPAVAFERFSQEIDLWWRTGPIYRTSEDSHLHIEPKLGGRFLDVHANSGMVREIGKVLVWDPGNRLQLQWRGTNFAANECTYIDVLFAGTQPHAHGYDATRVSVRHYGLSVLPPEHPARHGQSPAAFIRQQGRWWAALMESLQNYKQANQQPNPSPNPIED